MTKREVNNVAVENAMWEACQKLRNEEVGKKLWNFMKRTWVTALSELKRDADAPGSPEERREHFAKAFISDTLWRLYQSTEHGTMDISSNDAEQLFINVLSRPRIFPAEAGGSLAPPPKPWKLILDVVEDTFLEVTDAKVKDHSGTKTKKRKPPSKKPPGKFGGGGGGASQRPPAPSQDVPFWYRKLMGMEDAQPAAPARSVHAAHDAPPLPRWGGTGSAGERRSPERWDPNGGSWSRWQAPRSSARPTQRSRSPRGPTNALRHVHIPPLRAERPGPPPGDWRSASRRRGRRERRRSRERRRGTRGVRPSHGGPRRGSRRCEARGFAREARTLSRPGGRKRSRAATVTPRGPRSASPGQRETRETRETRAATRTATRSPRSPRETSKQPEASASRASSECSSPRAKSKASRRSASKASKASSKASKESQEEQAEVEEAKRSGNSSAEESQEKEKEPHMEKKKEQDESQAEEEPKEDEDEAEERSGGICLTEAKAEEEPSGGICLTEAKDVKKEPQEEDKDMFDDLDDVGLMAQLQGTLKEEELAAPEDESAEEADAEEAKESESHGEVCANVAKGICLNKEAPRCKTPFSASDRGGVFAGVFCHSCSEILECGWGEDRKKVDL